MAEQAHNLLQHSQAVAVLLHRHSMVLAIADGMALVDLFQ
jgi:hypothetical protein